MAGVESLQTLLHKLQSSITSAVALLPTEENVVPPKDGISLLDTKTDLFLSYLQNLAFLIIVKLQRYADDSFDEDETQRLDDAVVKQLAELRLYLEKGVRPIDGRLKSEIEKVLRAADSVGKPKSKQAKTVSKQDKSKARRSSDASASSASSAGSESDSGASSSNSEDSEDEVDEMAYRPSLAAFTKPQSASTATSDRKSTDKKPGIYRPPRINPTSLPTTDYLERKDRDAKRARPTRSAAVDDYISNELADTPAAQPSIGSTITAGGRRTISDKDRRHEDERRKYEESNFIRLPAESKKDRQKRKRLDRGGGGFGANEFGLGSLGEMGDRVGKATERAGKRRKY